MPSTIVTEDIELIPSDKGPGGGGFSGNGGDGGDAAIRPVQPGFRSAPTSPGCS